MSTLGVSISCSSRETPDSTYATHDGG